MTIEAKLHEMGLALPPSAPSRALFLPGKVTGNLLFLSGQICQWEGVPKYFGPVGDGFGMEEGQAATRARRSMSPHCPPTRWSK